MKLRLLGAAALVLLAAPAFAEVTGEYVEARSLSVHAGGCHYNGEVATAGREAVMAWKVDSGVVDGVRVDGLGVVAVVSGTDNLAQAETSRRSVLYVDTKASEPQKAVLVKMIRDKAAPALGTVVAVKSAPFVFATKDRTITVAAGEAAQLRVSRYPCNHCVMPAQTWYKPLVPGVGEATVAQGISTGFKDGTLNVSWTQETADNAFVGTFAF